ncbi:MAG: DUF3644 domain-containing protein [Bacteroidales bacterium]|nr:DUF3644 domain-containing protein [Bacteroidales bacterium]
MQLRKGKTKTILESSIECALLAVEIYNKPRAPFRVESYITHMIMAWTKLLQAHFNHTIGDRFYYKKRNGRYELFDGEKKAWELKTCISKSGDLSDPQIANLTFFMKLRNKIEHRHIEKDEIGLVIFGECQSLLYNYENSLIDLFGEEYAINESLAFALQFSRLRTDKQNASSKTLLSKEVKELREFIDKYRNSISDEIFDSQEYSVKLIQVPKISNTNRNDLAVEFVNWNSLSEEDRENYEQVTAIIKDKVITKEVVNPGKLKPGEVIARVNQATGQVMSHFDHCCLYFIFSIRPTKYDADKDPFDTNIKYCHYDEVHGDYVYQDEWVNFLITLISTGSMNRQTWKEHFYNRDKLNIAELESGVN